jgi:formylglycine-generating enzyme required for sulfatase activity
MLDDERPQHKVRIKNAYFLAATETTQQEYQRVVGSNPSHFRGDPRRPVDSVSWYDAVDFCKKLSDLPDERAAKRQYQLPTEAQWEYACRAGNQKAWFFSRHEGTTSEDRKLLGEYAWFSDDSCRLRDDVSRLTTHPVAQKKPNGWGLYDMYGNVFEWCQDWYAPYSSAPAVDPTGPSGNLVQPASGWRIQRGGAFFRSEFWCRSALRGMSNPEFRREHTGFRVCAVAIPNSGDTNSGDTHGVPGTHN